MYLPFIKDQNVSTIINHPRITSNRKLFTACLALYIDNPKLSIIDCALVVYDTLQKAIPLYTFDIDLAKACSATTQVPKL